MAKAVNSGVSYESMHVSHTEDIIDLKNNEKLKLQLLVEKELNDLKALNNNEKTQSLKDIQTDLLDTTKNNTSGELADLKQDILTITGKTDLTIAETEIQKKLNTLSQIDADIEKAFDTWILNNLNTIEGYNTETLESAFSNFVKNNLNQQILEPLKQKEILDVSQEFHFELTSLWVNVNNRITKMNKGKIGNTTSGSSSLNTNGGPQDLSQKNTNVINENGDKQGYISSGENKEKETEKIKKNEKKQNKQDKKNGGKDQDNSTSESSFTTNYTSQQYESSSYTGESTNEDFADEQDKKALKKILFNKDEAFDTYMDNYKVKGKEKDTLRSLKKAIKDIGLGEDEFGKAFKEIRNQYHEDPSTNRERFDRPNNLSGISSDKQGKKGLIVLGNLYALSKDQTNELPYFNKVMGMFEDEIVQKDRSDMSDIYNENNNLPTEKELGLIYKKFNANREAKKYYREVLEEGVLTRKTLNTFLKYNEKNNLQALVQKFIDETQNAINNGDSDPYYTGQGDEKEILEFLGTKFLGDNGMQELYEILTGQQISTYPTTFNFFNALVFSDMNIKDFVNAHKVNEKIDTKISDPKEKFITQLADLNFDGKNSFSDQANKPGLQIKELYEDAVGVIGQEKVLENLLDVALQKAKQDGVVGYEKTIGQIKQSTNKYQTLVDIINGTDGSFGDKGFLKFLQNTLVRSPIEAYDILKHGTEVFKIYQEEINKLDETSKKKIEDFIKEQLPDLEDPIVKAGLMEILSNIATTSKSSQNITNEGLGIGTSFSLDALLKGLSLSVGAGVVDGKPSVGGIMIGYNKNIELSEQSKLRLGIAGGTGGFMFLPIASINGGREHAFRRNSSNTLDLKNINSIDLGGNFTTIVTIPSRGLSAGMSIDRISAIEKQYTQIYGKITKIIPDLLTGLETATNRQDRISLIKKQIEKKYPESKNSPELIDKATFAIFEALTYFGAFEDGVTFNQNQKDTMIRLVSDFYATSRKDQQLAGMTKWKFENFTVGVQFLAGFFPIPSLCARISRYRNLYYQDTEESLKSFEVADQQGFGNEDTKKSPIEQINYLNTTLSRNKEGEIVPQIEKTDDEKYLLIPNTLWNKGYLNLVLDPKLKKRLGKETPDTKTPGLWQLKVPVNTKYRFLTQASGTQRSYILNIGDVTTDSDDLILSTQKSEIPADWFGTKEIPNTTTETYSVSIDYSKSFLDIKKTFENIYNNKTLIENLLNLDDTYIDNFYELLHESNNSNQTGTKNALIELLKKDNAVKNNSNIISLLTILESPTPDEKQIAYIIGEMKILFARDKELQKRGGQKTIMEAMKKHGDGWEKLTGPSKEPFDTNLLNELKKLKEDMKTSSNLDYTPTNIVGYTAWYRSQYGSYNHRNYSITTPASTEISKDGNKFYAKEIKTNKNEAMEWFKDNFTKDTPEQQIMKQYIIDSIVTNIEQKYNITIDRQKLTEQDIIQLLTGRNKEITLDNGIKITITSEVVPVFYLLEACANESIGVDIKDISVEVTKTTDLPGEFYTNTAESRSEAKIGGKQSISGGLSFVKRQDSPPIIEGKDGETITENGNNNSNNGTDGNNNSNSAGTREEGNINTGDQIDE